MALTLIVFLFTLSLLVFAHELGHFVVAKKAGIKVEEFGFGYPPRIWAKKIGGTIYSLNLLPIGGFVKLFGEELNSKSQIPNLKLKDAFFTKGKKVRAAVVAAGVAMNFLLAIAAFWLIYLILGIPVKTDKVKVIGVLESSPAAEAGITVDDVVVSVEGKKIGSVDNFISLVNENRGRAIEITLGRGSGEDTVKLTPRQDPPEGEGSLGVVISQVEPKFFPAWQMPALALRESLKETLGWILTVVGGVAQIVWNLITRAQAPKDIAGPVGIFQITGMVARQGILSIIQFIGILSINLMVINLLPFPPLDGGKLLFIGAEKLFGRRHLPKIERWVQSLGMIILLLLMLLVTINDISRFLSPAKPF